MTALARRERAVPGECRLRHQSAEVGGVDPRENLVQVMGAPSRGRRGRRGEGFKLEERFIEIFRSGEFAVRLFDGGSGPPQRTLQQRLPDPPIRVLKADVSLEQSGVLIFKPQPEMI